MNRARAALLALAAVGFAQPAVPAFDLILRGGAVVDGTGGAPFVADVGISGAYIAAIGDLSANEAPLEIDARGLHVAPGFINLHSHATADGLRTAENMLTQGVTTEILNADGGGPVDIGPQLAGLAERGLAVNVGANIGFNSAWTSVVGEADRRPTPDDIRRMRDILFSNLERGAWGVSSGLDYKPAYFAHAEEVVEVVSAAAPWRTIFTNHDRLTPESRYSSRAGIAETLAIGQRARLVPLVTHMKVQGREQGTAAAVLRLMSDATSRGQYAAADAYPYLAGQSGLGALIIPAWAQDGGRARMLERFKDPATRARIVVEAEEAMAARFGGPAGVFLPASRRELTDVMRERNLSAGETLVSLLEEDDAGAILRFGAEEDLIRILQHPATSVACDCGAVTPGRASHPRYYGTFPRVLGRYVRETNAMTLAQAVRKMTLLPAATIGMVDRGAIAVGMAADVTIFDAGAVIDRATFEEPTSPSVGIRHVLVNGRLALRDGVVTDERGGRTLARTKHMPARATNGGEARRVRANGVIAVAGGPDGHVTVALDLSQRAGARAATGTLTLTGGAGGSTLRARAVGFLQTAGNWASVTARLRDERTGADHAVLVLVEARDPWLEGRSPSVTLVIDGQREMTGPLTGGTVDVGR